MNSTNVPHDSSYGHVSGTSDFIDDRPELVGELHVDCIYSTIPRGKILKISTDSALAIPGAHSIFTAEDLAHNVWGTIIKDQPCLAEKETFYVGEPIAVLAAESREALRQMKKEVVIEYEALDPILSIPKAIEKEEFIGPRRSIQRGDLKSAFSKSDHIIESEIFIPGQDHFYLESNACIAYPGENGSIEIHSSSQHPSEVQHVVAHALGLHYHQVVCVVKRMGGGFGGKESQAAPFAVMASLVASRTGRSARFVLTKDDDMISTGKRNPFLNQYKVGFNTEGQILGAEFKLFSDGGAYADLSTSIMERAMLHSDNAYYLPNVSITGQVCRTNYHPSTAFRGFGGPKGVLTIENIIEDIAYTVGKDPLDIRKLNCYEPNTKNRTPYGQEIKDDVLHQAFDRLEDTSGYRELRKSIDEKNRIQSKSVEGLSLTAVKFGISFTTRFLNQANALVNVQYDGTIQVSTGATEMGQGTNTKIAQVVAECFSIGTEKVKVMATSTEKNANTSPSAASSCADLNGSAALEASQRIRERLARIADQVLDRPKEKLGRKHAASGVTEELDISSPCKNNVLFENGQVFRQGDRDKKLPLEAIVKEAYYNRVSLSEYGYFRYPGIYFNKETGQGKPFFYFTNGVAMSHVSIDRYTGELKVLRSEILMDVGDSLNDGIDRGQVLGGFVQGMGWLTTENLYYKDGFLVSHSPSTYKIPSIHDIPREFHLNWITDNPNSKNLRGSKTVGEPPLLLATSVWAAVKNAISYLSPKVARKMPVPATQENILRLIVESEVENGGLKSQAV